MKATIRLYELSADYLNALDALSDLDELPPEVITDTLEALAGVWEDKALNVARYIRNLEAEADAIEEAKKRMEIRAKTMTNRAARLKDYLKAELERTGLKPKAPDVALSLRTNPPSVILEDESRIPDDYRRTETVTRILKSEISNALKAGARIPGARLEQSRRLVIQ